MTDCTCDAYRNAHPWGADNCYEPADENHCEHGRTGPHRHIPDGRFPLAWFNCSGPSGCTREATG